MIKIKYAFCDEILSITLRPLKFDPNYIRQPITLTVNTVTFTVKGLPFVPTKPKSSGSLH